MNKSPACARQTGTTFTPRWPVIEGSLKVISKGEIRSNDLASESFVLFVFFCSVSAGNGLLDASRTAGFSLIDREFVSITLRQ